MLAWRRSRRAGRCRGVAAAVAAVARVGGRRRVGRGGGVAAAVAASGREPHALHSMPPAVDRAGVGEGAGMSFDDSAIVACRFCGRANAGDRRRCEGCWSSLAGAASMDPVSGERALRALGRNQRWRQAAKLALLALVAGAAGLWGFVTFGPERALAPATTNLSSSATTGGWSMASHDISNTRFAAEAPAFSGVLRWQFKTGQPFLASPAATTDAVFIATADGRIVALDALTGATRWEMAMSSPVNSTPSIAGDTLYVGSRDGRLVALDAANGAMRWVYEAEAALTAASVVAGGEVYIGDGDGRLHAVDAGTGQRRWRSGEGQWIDSLPAVTEHYVVVAADEDVRVFERETGKLAVTLHVWGGATTDPVIIGDRLYIGSSRGTLLVFDLDWRPPFLYRDLIAELWVRAYIWRAAPEPPTPILSELSIGNRRLAEMAVAEGVLYIGGGDGNVVAMDVETGESRWRYKAGSGVETATVVGGDAVYTGATDGVFSALDRATGAIRWQFPAMVAAGTTPAVTGNGIYIAGGDGTLYALR
ncbi:MAG: hypothetical protein EXR43_01255 [Dehalococcoidia bacterium]|nr:hypothetical protein [Dehalococcoidia bacterium]